MLISIYLFGRVLIVNSRCYGRCYVKKLLPPCIFLKFYTHLEENSPRSFQMFLTSPQGSYFLCFQEKEFFLNNNKNNNNNKYFISPHGYYNVHIIYIHIIYTYNIYIQQINVVGVLAARNNLKVKNVRQSVKRRDI